MVTNKFPLPLRGGKRERAREWHIIKALFKRVTEIEVNNCKYKRNEIEETIRIVKENKKPIIVTGAVRWKCMVWFGNGVRGGGNIIDGI